MYSTIKLEGVMKKSYPHNSELLKKVKKKWDKIIDENGLDQGTANCAFCQAYDRIGSWSCSKECPIFIFAGVDRCRETPYVEWVKHQRFHKNEFPNKVECPECLKLARAERIFLDNLDEICNENTEHTVILMEEKSNA